MIRISVKVVAHDVIFVRDYIGKNHEFSEKHGDLHQVEFFFRATIQTGETVALGPLPDNDQVGVVWLPIADLAQYPLYTRKLIPALVDKHRSKASVIYLGDVN